jgi:hypothetical protein
MSENGKVTAKAARAAVTQQPAPWQPKMYRLTMDECNSRDMKRAKATVLEGKDPWEWLQGEESDEADVRTLIIWMLKSRHIPGFTWEQAEETPYGEFRPASEEPPPPLGEPPGSSGLKAEQPTGSGSSSGPPPAEAAPSSASSTG